MENYVFKNMNSRDNYFSVHNIFKAHSYSLGENVKIGVIDWLFGYEKHKELYAGFIDMVKDSSDSLNEEGHGYWMVNTLKEIAPKCKVYAINAVVNETQFKSNYDDVRVELIDKAVDYAIENNIRILTYSHASIRGSAKEKLNKVLEKAYNANIITTFIHCDSKYNLFPFPCFKFDCYDLFNREMDFNIYSYDYNVLLSFVYDRYYNKQNGEVSNEVFLSYSSTSVVLGGFIALLLSLNKNLSFDEVKRLLTDTLYSRCVGSDLIEKIIDIGSACESLTIK